MQVQKIDLSDTSNISITVLPMLHRRAHYFQVAKNHTDLVFLTGGQGNAAKLCSLLNLKTLSWEQLPEMNFGRSSHGSCCLGEAVYVFAGMENQGSVERLQYEQQQEWVVIA